MRRARINVLLPAALVAVLFVLVLASGCGPATLTSTTAVPDPITLPAAPSTTETSLVPPASSTTETPSTTETSPRPDAVSRMDVRAKAAQVLMVSFDGTVLTAFTQSMLAQAAPGGVLILGRNVEGKEQLRSLTAALQKAATAEGAPGLFVAADEEGGPVMRIKQGVPDLPAARDVGSLSTAAQAEALARATATGLLEQGVNMVFAPVADVVADKDSFLYDRSYGGDPETVSGFVTAVTQGLIDGGVVTVVKHFPGHGSAPENSHTSAPVSGASREQFDSVHLPPFRAAIAAGTEGLMVGHFIVPAYDPLHPASQSGAIIEDLLRRDLGFQGLVISDDLEMSAATGRTGKIGTASPAELGGAAVAALAAGCDLLITSGTFDRQTVIRQAIVDAVQSGALSEERLDEAVARILSVKSEHGLPVPGSVPR